MVICDIHLRNCQTALGCLDITRCFKKKHNNGDVELLPTNRSAFSLLCPIVVCRDRTFEVPGIAFWQREIKITLKNEVALVAGVSH